MRMRCYRFVLAISAVPVLMAGTSVSANADPNHCRSNETAVFNCPVSGGNKVLSLCVGTLTPAGDGYLQYRFGPIGKPDLIFPDSLAGSHEQFRIHSVTYAGGWDTRVGFSVGAYTYQVYDQAYSLGPQTPDKDVYGGVMVFRDGRRIANVRCDLERLPPGIDFGGLNQLYDVLKTEPFFDPE